MSEGAGEGGREAHSLDGAYAVYPGGQFYTSILPYFAAQDLPGKTGMVSSAMTSFSIGVDENGDSVLGERVSTSYNAEKINGLWRAANGWDGYILTDFNTHVDKVLRHGRIHRSAAPLAGTGSRHRRLGQYGRQV